jgi:hypothetical protein
VKRAAALLDLVFVLLFVAIGRSSHHHGLTFRGVVSTTWPFAVGLGVGWLLVALTRQSGISLRSGVAVVVVTVVVGMILRVLAGQGTAFAFVVVALAFLGLMMLGWRFFYVVLSRRRVGERPRK